MVDGALVSWCITWAKVNALNCVGLEVFPAHLATGVALVVWGTAALGPLSGSIVLITFRAGKTWDTVKAHPKSGFIVKMSVLWAEDAARTC